MGLIGQSNWEPVGTQSGFFREKKLWFQVKAVQQNNDLLRHHSLSWQIYDANDERGQSCYAYSWSAGGAAALQKKNTAIKRELKNGAVIIIY